MSTGRRLVRVAVALGCAAWCCGCSVEIIHDVDEGTANEVLATLDRHGIQGDKKRETRGNRATYTVAVPRAEAAQAWKVLRQENLPRPERQGLGEVFGKTGLVPTATQERALMHHALAGELSRTLEGVEGVLEARVHLVLPTRDPLAPPDSQQSASKASVLLRVGQRSPLANEELQRLVAGAVVDLDPKSVSVVIVRDQQRRTRKPAAGTEQPLRSVGPFRVGAGSRAALLATLIGGLVVLALLGTVTMLLLRRNRALAAKVQAGGGAGATSPGAGASALDGSLSLLGRSLSSRSGSRATGAKRDSS